MSTFTDMSLTDFLIRYSEIMEDESSDNLDRDLVNFALAGIDVDESRFRINMVNTYRLRIGGGMPNITRDYDSFIGFTDRIPIKRDLYLYALPPHHISTIAQSMHLKVPFRTSKGIQNLDPSTVPNVLLGKYNDRHQLRIFFPSLWSETQSSVKLTSEKAEMLYDDILYPTVVTVAPALAKDWPTSLEVERFRSRTTRSAFQNTAYILSADIISLFKHELSRRLQEHEFFKHAVFCTHIQGIKASTMHDMSALSADIALTRMLEDFDTVQGLWWVDVGLEIQDGDRAILWRKDAAPNLLSYVLGNTLDEAGRIVHSTQFQEDVNSHLLEVAGFRVGFVTPIGDNEIAYVQAYTTDKSLTYHKHGFQHSQALTGLAALTGNPPKYCTDLTAAYTDAKQKNVAARLEVRLPIEFALQYMLEFDYDVLRHSVLSVHRENFWNWRIVRMDAFSRLLSAMNDQSAEQTVTTAVMSTYAAVVWMINGVHSRPNSESGGRACQKIAIPLFEDYSATDLQAAGYADRELNALEEQYAESPFSPFNVVFMRRIFFPPETNTVRLPMGRVLPEKFYNWMFGKSLADLRLQFKATGIIRRRDLPAQRYPMNKGLSRARIGPTPASAFFVGLSEIEEEPVIDVGPDVPVNQQVFDDEEQERTVEEKVADIWAQFPCCVLQKIGNPKSKWSLPSYCRIHQQDRQKVTIDVMKDTNLAKVFARVQVSLTTIQRWRTAFEACFPPKGHITPKSAQAWTQMRYYMNWKTLVASLQAPDADRVREILWHEFEKLTWIPAATGDRPWRTDRQSSWTQLPPLDHQGPFSEPNIPGPQILWSPFADPNIVWDPSVPLVLALPPAGSLRVNGEVPDVRLADEDELSGDEAEEAEVLREISVVDDGHPGGPRGRRENREESAPAIQGGSRQSTANSNRHGHCSRPRAHGQQRALTDFFEPPRSGSPFASPRIGTPGGPQRRQSTLSDFFTPPRSGRPSATPVGSRASSRAASLAPNGPPGRPSATPVGSLINRTHSSLGRRSRREEEESQDSVTPDPKRIRVGLEDDGDDEIEVMGVDEERRVVDIEALRQEEEESSE
ncbi:hypothetical protein PC9H_009192 [Pleurotus ostreatus]|uniref:Uncharacterized protein n=1 Tax=Pleurotus ostreatus TaxID=5322 RepID=A0A8H6ZQF5_PLEOS|nr:uncharacterized protein PC9H_009192 [Pleurotus ostreatus]KAF7426823.1 hypothetical protein PC9H_009192 [Pleurotus ostreatus]KAJ8694435.1 hypothetical protein PTI98_009359 [Pleurotus ostreatus]